MSGSHTRVRPAPPPRGGGFQASAPLDSLIATLLAIAAVVPLGSSYDGWSWSVVAAIGAVAGAAVAIALRAARQGMAAIVGILFVTYVVLAGPVALHGTDATVAVPGPGTIEEVTLGSIRAWGLLIGTHPVVAPTGPVMLVPFLFGLAGSGVAAGLALTSRRAWAPLPVPLVVLGLSLVLGRAEPAWVVATGCAVTLGSLGWLTARGWLLAPKSGSAPAPRGWSVTRAILAAGLVGIAVLAAVPLAAPLTGTDRFVLRDAASTPALATLETPLSDFRDFTQPAGAEDSTLFGKRLLTVTGMRPGQRLRFVALDSYSDGAWRPANGTDPTRRDDRFLRMPPRLDTPTRGKRESVRVEVGPHWSGPWVPTIGDVRTLDLDTDDRAQQVAGLRYDPATGSALLPVGLQPGDSYTFTSRVRPDRLTRAMRPFSTIDPDLYEAGAFIDDYAAAWSARAADPMDAVFRVARKLRLRGRYSDGGIGWESQFGPGHDQRRLGGGFLSAPRMAGNDEQYAATMALLANRLRVPARVVVGATVGKDGVVQGRDVSAWVEIRIADGSWRTLPTERFMSTRPVRRTDKVLTPITVPPATQEPPEPVDQQPATPETDPHDPQTDTADKSGTQDNPARRWWVFLPSLLVSAVPLVKLARRSRRRRSGSPSARAAAAWREVIDHARDLGYGRPAGATRPRQGASLGDDVEALATQIDTAVFASTPPEQNDIDAVWARARTVTSALARSRPWWRRLLAPLNPASLTRRS